MIVHSENIYPTKLSFFSKKMPSHSQILGGQYTFFLKNNQRDTSIDWEINDMKNGRIKRLWF